MKTEAVKKLDPYHRLVYFINERESIRRKRALGLPPPWTDDEILGSYRFCNVRRMDDKVSQWLLNNWYKPYKDHPNILIAVVLARHFNLPSTLEAIGFPVEWLPEVVKKTLLVKKGNGQNLFNSAYIVPGDASFLSKVHSVIDGVVRWTISLKPLTPTDSMKSCVEYLSEIRGLGSFLAGQIVADLRWAMSGSWKDRYTYAPMGPGSKRGMNRVQGRDKDSPLKQEKFLDELVHLVQRLEGDLSNDITRRLEMMDYQNCLCETDKYFRVLLGEGKPKKRYIPGEG